MDSKDVKSIYPCAPPYEDAIQMNYPAPVIQNQILPSNNLPANAVMAPTHVVVRGEFNKYFILFFNCIRKYLCLFKNSIFFSEAANNTQICSYCHAPLYTETRYRTNGHTHLMALLCCVYVFQIIDICSFYLVKTNTLCNSYIIFRCFCCLCAPFVYCMDSCREPRLHCRKCKQMVM